ncbi:tRNA lysidine(34) synthetase TilS [Hydrogenophaga luteola]|uniref:tRNA(Ile)-lysidine synthase n=1 Tax=Hydrogenophaga luteola TaxID=1591122 RepID=A0ABV7W7A2_9BURK
MTASSNPCGPALLRWSAQGGPDTWTKLAVAYSAGADSTALLVAAHALWPGRVVALHVHHGLQAAADAFETTARTTCDRLGVPLHLAHVRARPARGQSPEDAARLYRYRALADLAKSAGAGLVLLAHHADDQAETLMLALSRGGGLPGLAAMPDHFERHGMRFARPLLEIPAGALRAWVECSGEPFADDPSNADLRFTRNRIRKTLLPAWEACFPGFRLMLARSARHAAQAQQLLDDLARIDLAAVGEPPSITGLQVLSRERQANVLRHWLRSGWGVVPTTAQMEQVLNQVTACLTRGHRIELKVADGTLRRDGGHLTFGRPTRAAPI